MIFSVQNNSGIISFFHEKIDISELFDWFKENEHEIRSSDLPIDKGNGKSLARIIRDFYENVDTEDDEVVDSIFDYRSCHYLRFAVRGTLIPEIYIGKSENNHEISMYCENREWQYFIDIDDFFNHLKDQYNSNPCG